MIDNLLDTLIEHALRILLAEVWVCGLFCRRSTTNESINRMLELNFNDLNILAFLLLRLKLGYDIHQV